MSAARIRVILLFQPTLPVRGATVAIIDIGEHYNISIHAPRAGSDHLAPKYLPILEQFQSTLPVRGATPSRSCRGGGRYISIHAPRAGSDLVALAIHTIYIISIHAPRAGSDLGVNVNVFYGADFNPRSPCGERP